jgi:hypothetical protein
MQKPLQARTVSAPPPREHKRKLKLKLKLQNVFIALFLAVQIGVPLRYYLGDHDYDERFSWRMFSTLRLRDCTVHVIETPRGAGATQHPVAIEQDVHVAWVRLLERMRSAVVDKYLRRRCELAQVDHVEYVRTCKDTDGSELPATRVNLSCDEASP